MSRDTTRDAPAIAAAVAGQDAVVSALGVRNAFKSGGLIQASLAAIVPAMQQAGVRRLILVSAFGVGESRREAPLVPRIMYRLLLRDIFADKLAAEQGLRASALDWTILYPVLLTDGPADGKHRAGERLDLKGMPKIARANVAHFALREIEAPAWVGKAVVLAD